MKKKYLVEAILLLAAMSIFLISCGKKKVAENETSTVALPENQTTTVEIKDSTGKDVTVNGVITKDVEGNEQIEITAADGHKEEIPVSSLTQTDNGNYKVEEITLTSTEENYAQTENVSTTDAPVVAQVSETESSETATPSIVPAEEPTVSTPDNSDDEVPTEAQTEVDSTTPDETPTEEQTTERKRTVIHHPAVTHQETVYEEKYVIDDCEWNEYVTGLYYKCSCGEIFYDVDELDKHAEANIFSGIYTCGAWSDHPYIKEIIHHDEVGHYEKVAVGTKTVVDSEAWDEVIYE